MTNRLWWGAPVLLALAGCATVEAPTRNITLEVPPLAGPDGSPAPVERNYALAGIEVIVPPDLRVSERNGYYPFTDIVWRGDPPGNRHVQVAELFRLAAGRHLRAPDAGQRPVIVDVQLARFHGVTERTRYSIGGVYHIRFQMQVRDAATGEVIEPWRMIESNLPAPGGQAAVELERAGQTEKVRVVDHLTWTFARELGL